MSKGNIIKFPPPKEWKFAVDYKKIFFALLLLVLIAGCKGKKDVSKALEEIRSGTEGIIVSFLPNSPPPTIHAEKSGDNSFEVVLELKNKGAYPQPEDKKKLSGKIYLSGYDSDIITFKEDAKNDLSKLALEGKSTINPNGGQDLISFDGEIKVDILNVEKYEPTLLATACYNYETVASTSVCIDPNPYSTVKEKKVCEVQDVALSSQGAPIAVIKIDEEAFATKTQFKITIKNVGSGDVISVTAMGRCNPSVPAKLGREDIDKVKLESIKVSDKSLKCRPFAEDGTTEKGSGIIRLINGEGYIICELPKNDYGKSSTAYTTPLTIKLSYAYRTTAERKLQIKKDI